MDTATFNRVHKQYGNQTVLDHVTLTVPKGYITGLIGSNGAGKSTMIRMMMGMVLPDSGKVSVMNQIISTSNSGKYREQIGYVADENIYGDHLTALQIKNIIAPFYSNWDDMVFEKYMDLFQLPHKKKLRTYSKGMKMKYSLVLALSHSPSFLIMDEPTAGLDPVFRRELLDIISEYILDEEKTVLFSSHLTTDLDKIADYIIFLHEGKVIIHEPKDLILDSYVLIKGSSKLLDGDIRKELTGIRETAVGFEALSHNREHAISLFGDQVIYEYPTLEEIMYYTVKGGNTHA